MAFQNTGPHIPASAPIGVKKAQIFEPITEAKTAFSAITDGAFAIMELKRTLMGMLFMRFAV